MATLTLNTGSVRHTLPTRYLGMGRSRYFSQDSADTEFTALCTGLGIEIFRMCNFDDSMGTPGTPNATFANLFAFVGIFDAVGVPTLFQGGCAPASTPTTRSPSEVANIHAGDRSPANQSAWVQHIIDTYGSDALYGIEITNEPANNRTGQNGDWYDGGNPDTDSTNAAKWFTSHVDQYYARFHADFPTVKAHGWTIANIQNNGDTTQYLDGYSGWRGGTAVSSGANLPYQDVLAFHLYSVSWPPTYPNFPDSQSGLNQIFYPTFTNTWPGSAGKAAITNLRSLVDARGFSTMPFSMTEIAIYRTDYIGGLADVAYSILFCDMQATWNMDSFYLFGINRDQLGLNGGGDSVIMTTDSGASFFGSVRYYAIRDICSTFIKNYKKILTQTWTVSPGTGPNGNLTNPVPRLQVVAGLSSDSKTVAIMACNVDLTNAETLTVDLGATPTGNVTGKYIPNSLAVNTALPSITPITPSGNTFSKSIGPGEAYLFLVPISGTAPVPPANVDAPVITGGTIKGATLSVSNGTWSNSPTSYAYQWTRNSVAISAATSSTYTLLAADVATSISCSVTATNSAGSTTAGATAVGPILDQASFTNVPVVDDFNRANGAVGANWTNVQGCTITPTVNTNQLKEGTS